MKKEVKKKKWIPEMGETFYFIYHSGHYASQVDRKDFVDLNKDGECLVIGDADFYDVCTDTESNCFRTKAQAKRALRKIHEALKFTGE